MAAEIRQADRDGRPDVGRTAAEEGKGSELRVLATSCQGPRDPAFRVRLELPGLGLSAHQVAVELLPLFSAEQARRFREGGAVGKARTLSSARWQLRRELRQVGEMVPAIIVQRHVDLAPTLSLEKTAVRDRRLIYDVDDAVWLTGRQAGGHPLGALKGASRKVRWLAERAEHVIAGNEILAEHLARYNDAVTVVPSLIDPSSHALRVHTQSEVVTLGWIGSSTTAHYLWRVKPVLEQFARQSRRPIQLLVVGGSAPPIVGVRVNERSWSPDAERDALADMDIGLMPLEDTYWSRGKCAYKALQYMACGIPPLVDDVGISAATVNGAGHVARNAAQWLEGLHTLADDPDLRSRLGQAGRRRIEEEFSLERWVPTIAGILRGDAVVSCSHQALSSNRV